MISNFNKGALPPEPPRLRNHPCWYVKLRNVLRNTLVKLIIDQMLKRKMRETYLKFWEHGE